MNARSIDGLPAVERAGWFAARLMGGVIPDAEVAGYKKRRTPEEAVEAARARREQRNTNGNVVGNGIRHESAGVFKTVGSLLDVNANENGKLVLGVVIGFAASFVVSDLMSLGRSWKRSNLMTGASRLITALILGMKEAMRSSLESFAKSMSGRREG